jgi:hypothetical protein
MSLADTITELMGPAPVEPTNRADHMRILLLDIETYPALVWQWSLWDQHTPLQRVEREDGMLSFAAKWYREPETEFHAVWTQGGPEGMAQRAHQLLCEADAVVTYNGGRFDIPWLERVTVENGLGPWSPFAHIDLFRTVRQGRWLSKKLDAMCRKLDLGAKVEHEGFPLWTSAMPTWLGGKGDPGAQGRMEAYNRGDVSDTLEPLYDEMLPYIKGHPHVGLYAGDGTDRCQRCGSPDLQLSEQTAKTPLSVYPMYRCGQCRSWSRGKTRLWSVDARAVQ